MNNLIPANNNFSSGSLDQMLNTHAKNLIEEQLKNIKDQRSFEQVLELEKQNTQGDEHKSELNGKAINSVNEISDAKKQSDWAKMEKTAKEFESVFISQMLKPMFESVEVDPMFGGGHAEEVFRSMLVQEYGKNISTNGGLGFKDALMTQFQAYQEGSQ